MRIRLSAEVTMPQANKKAPAPRKPTAQNPRLSPERAKFVDEMLVRLKRERQERVGPNATFEQRRDADFEIMGDLLWLAEDEELRESVTDADEVDVDGKKFQRLEQASSATYFGRFGGHHIEEAASRAVVGPARVARRPRNPRTRSV